MELRIDGRPVTVHQGQSLRELAAQVGLEDVDMKNRPLAAKIAGEVFTLNYIPLRPQESDPDRPSIRRAVAASRGEVRLLRYSSELGKEAYIRTAQFVIFLALRQLWPKAVGKMACTLGDSVFISVSGEKSFSPERLKEKVAALVAEDIPLIRRRVSLEQALEHFRRDGEMDKARLLSWRTVPYFDEYVHGDFADYYYGEMLPSTGYLQVWDILPAEGGFIFVYPDDADPNRCAPVPSMPNFFQVYNEGERWCQLMECETVADLRSDHLRTDSGADPGQRSPP